MRDDLDKDAVPRIRIAVALGRDTYSTIVADTAEYLELDDQAAHARIRELAAHAFADHVAEQETWPGRTGSDVLTDAFRDLDAAGITAREDFACCQNCGVTEIADEAAGLPTRGYVFYHQQDAERGADGGTMWLSYGPDAEVGNTVVETLRARGLVVDWSGDQGQRIHVRMRWARRRWGRLSAYPISGLTDPEVDVRLAGTRRRLEPMPAAVLAQVELPWLPAGVDARIGEVSVHREYDRLITGDGRVAGRFDGALLLAGGSDPAPAAEPGLLEVAFESKPSGQSEAGVPMILAEALDVLRRLPTRTESWLAATRGDGLVQLRWIDGELWLETPLPEQSASLGKNATLVEAEQILTVLSVENRVAIADLPGVTVQPW